MELVLFTRRPVLRPLSFRRLKLHEKMLAVKEDASLLGLAFAGNYPDTTIRLSKEFVKVDIPTPLETFGHIINSVILDPVNASSAALDKNKLVHKTWPKLYRRHTIDLFRLQRSILTGHCIMGTYLKRMGQGHMLNDFYIGCRDEGKEKTVNTRQTFISCPVFASLEVPVGTFEKGRLHR